MKFEIWVILLGVSTVMVLGENPTELVLQRRLDSFEEKFSNALERLVASVSENKVQNEQLAANNSRLLERIANLETLGETVSQNQKSMEDQINGVKLQISEVVENSRKLLKNQPIYTVSSCKMASTSGVYKLTDLNGKEVYCDADGGWVVIQQRTDLSLNFNRSWSEYRSGFGEIGRNGNFWLGNELIHQIVSGGEFELSVEFRKNKNHYSARYTQIHVAGEDDKYRLKVEGHSGDLPDELKLNNNMQFTTYDSDNDRKVDQNCAISWATGGWWYNDCGKSNLNDEKPYWSRIVGSSSRMMIRRK